MNHNVGEVSYDIRFARQKASQDIAAIEAEWNAALARMNSKGVGVSGGGGGGAPAGVASGGYAGQSAGNGQPVQGAPASNASAFRTRDRAMQAIFDAQLAAGNVKMRNEFGELVPVPPGGGTVAPNGQPTQQARGGARILGTSNGDVSVRQGMTPSAQAGGVPTTTKEAVAWLKPVILGAAINAIATEIASEANFSKNMTLAGTSGTLQAQAMVQRRKDLFGMVPIIGGSLGTIATAADEAYLQKTQGESDMNDRFNQVGTSIAVNRMRGRAMGVKDSYGRAILESKTSQTDAEATIRRERAKEFEKDVKPKLRSEVLENPSGSEPGNFRNPDQMAGPRARQAAAIAENKALTEAFHAQTGALISSLPQSRERAAMTRQFDISLAHQGVELTERNYNNAMRPGAGAAAGALGRFAIDKEYTQGDIAAVDGDSQEGKDLRGRLRSGLVMRGNLEKAGLEGQRMEALRNAFGGRPQEIGGMQSVEAMRDISPESNELRIGELSDAIEKLTNAINNMQKGVP